MAYLTDIRATLPAGAPIGTFLGRCAQTLLRLVRHTQHARMIAVLNDMSDARLAAIGITRDEIPDYAADMVRLT